MKIRSLAFKFLFTGIVSLISVMQLFAIETHSWYIVLDKPLDSDEAIQVAINDLNTAGEAFGIHFIETTNTNKKYTGIPVDIQSRSFGPFVLEQPSAENDYTVTLYLSDSPMHGYSWWKFELYYIPRPPEELGLAVPWGK